MKHLDRITVAKADAWDDLLDSWESVVLERLEDLDIGGLLDEAKADKG